MRAKLMLVSAVLGALALCLTVRVPHLKGQTPTPQRAKFFTSYAHPHRVTIRRNGALLTTLEVPGSMQPNLDVFLSVYYDDNQPSIQQAGRFEFHGDVEIRTRPRREVDSNESNRGEEVMAKAPLVLTAKDVDVVVEQVGR
jgi:hypothetical protein